MRPTIRVLQALANNARRKETTSFIGLGRMGYEMANNLFSKTYKASQDTQFVVCDALPETAHAFREAFIKKHPGSSVTVADDPHQAALASSTIITMLPSSPQVEEVYSRIVPALSSLPKSQKAETLCIDSTTLDVEVARKVASDVTGLGSRMVDAPVSGGVSGAHAGTLAFLVGGPKDSFELARPILTLMGQRIIHCGDSGAGLGAKICNNLVLGVEQIVIAEAMLLGGKLGLDPAILASVINSSTGSCWSCSVNNPVPSALPGKTPPCEKDYEGGFATALMLKDMGLAAEIAAKQKSALPLGLAARDLYSKVVSEEPSLARKDFSSVYKFLEKK
ncbi:3-hydroxyisobutyrate dehydrogenase [Coprinopsis sp. MPI-PUGE-AT-0042]|nr:3-hydroxyisobutyrate dehydrogenase [Coprinopsis sp. MPI-PUGE-AT-0042]